MPSTAFLRAFGYADRYNPMRPRGPFGYSHISHPVRRGPGPRVRPYPQPGRQALGYPKQLQAFDRVESGQVVSTTPGILLLTSIVEGTGLENRAGQHIMLRSLTMTLNIFNDSVETPQQLRFMIVYDRQCNGAAPTITDILTTSSPLSPPSLNDRWRFRILKDKMTNLQVFGGAADMPQIKTLKLDLARMNLPVTFNAGNAGTVADCSAGSLWLVTLGDQATGTSDTVMNFHSRVRFNA